MSETPTGTTDKELRIRLKKKIIKFGDGNLKFKTKDVEQLLNWIERLEYSPPSPPSPPTVGAKEFRKRLGDLFFKGIPTMDMIIDAHNQSFAQSAPQVSEEEIQKGFAEWCSSSNWIYSDTHQHWFDENEARMNHTTEDIFEEYLKTFPSAPTITGITDSDIREMFPQNPNATYEDEVRDNLNQTERIIGAIIFRDKLTAKGTGLDLNKLERKLDESLDKETAESIKSWLREERNQSQRKGKGKCSINTCVQDKYEDSEFCKKHKGKESGEQCKHLKKDQVHYHDQSILCTKCNCIISQYGESINPPTSL